MNKGKPELAVLQSMRTLEIAPSDSEAHRALAPLYAIIYFLLATFIVPALGASLMFEGLVTVFGFLSLAMSMLTAVLISPRAAYAMGAGLTVVSAGLTLLLDNATFRGNLILLPDFILGSVGLFSFVGMLYVGTSLLSFSRYSARRSRMQSTTTRASCCPTQHLSHGTLSTLSVHAPSTRGGGSPWDSHSTTSWRRDSGQEANCISLCSPISIGSRRNTCPSAGMQLSLQA